MYIFGEDVAQTDPDTHHVVEALESLEFLVCQDIFETETTKYADVILPASAFLEKTGTFTNAERRLQLVSASADPPGAAKTDFEILTTVSAALGHPMDYATPSDVMDEIAALTPDLAGVSFERLGRKGLMWPVAADGTDSPILYEEEFELPGGKAQLAALPFKPPGTEADDEFPMILVTGRRLQHYNSGSMTRRTATSSCSTASGWRSTPRTPSGSGSTTATSSRCAARPGASRSRRAPPTRSSRGTCSRRSTSRRCGRTC